LVRRLCSGTSSRKLEDCSLRSARFITPPRGSRMKSVEPRRRVTAQGLAFRAVQLSCHIASSRSWFGKCLIEREFWRGRYTQGRPIPVDRCQQTPPRVSRLASLIRQGRHGNRMVHFHSDSARAEQRGAAFSEESRMRFVNAPKVRRKSGGCFEYQK